MNNAFEYRTIGDDLADVAKFAAMLAAMIVVYRLITKIKGVRHGSIASG